MVKNKIRFNNDNVARLKPAETRYEIADADILGFSVRVLFIHKRPNWFHECGIELRNKKPV